MRGSGTRKKYEDVLSIFEIKKKTRNITKMAEKNKTIAMITHTAFLSNVSRYRIQ